MTPHVHRAGTLPPVSARPSRLDEWLVGEPIGWGRMLLVAIPVSLALYVLVVVVLALAAGAVR